MPCKGQVRGGGVGRGRGESEGGNRRVTIAQSQLASRSSCFDVTQGVTLNALSPREDTQMQTDRFLFHYSSSLAQELLASWIVSLLPWVNQCSLPSTMGTSVFYPFYYRYISVRANSFSSV